MERLKFLGNGKGLSIIPRAHGVQSVCTLTCQNKILWRQSNSLNRVSNATTINIVYVINCLLRYLHSLFVKIWYDCACSSLYALLLCPSSGMNTTKIEYVISQVKHVSFEQGIIELVRAKISRVTSDAKTVVYGIEPRYRPILIPHTYPLDLLTPERE